MRQLLLLLLCFTASAQNPGVFQRLLNNVSAATASAVVTNNGQIGHQVTLLFSNAPSHTCSAPAGSAQLEYSFDGTTYYPFGSPQSATTANNGQIYVGEGLFAYVRFNLISFDTTDCLATAWYGGSQQPLAVQLGGPVGSTATLVLCDKGATTTFTDGGSFPVQLIAKPSAGAIHVCSISVQVTGATTAHISYGANLGACGSGTDLIQSGPVVTGVTNFGSGALGQLFLAPAGNLICFNYSGLNNGITFIVTVNYTVF